MLMRKHSFNNPLLYCLVAAFLSLQWSATHIHLAGEHEHDGGQHQHVVTAHQHQLASHHPDAIDVASDILSHDDSSKIVELEYICAKFHGSLSELFVVVPSTECHSFKNNISLHSFVALYQQDAYQNYHQYTSNRLRAPPVIS